MFSNETCCLDSNDLQASFGLFAKFLFHAVLKMLVIMCVDKIFASRFIGVAEKKIQYLYIYILMNKIHTIKRPKHHYKPVKPGTQLLHSNYTTHISLLIELHNLLKTQNREKNKKDNPTAENIIL
jgi:hypothetical protein